jgi:hypothetical protein
MTRRIFLRAGAGSLAGLGAAALLPGCQAAPAPKADAPDLLGALKMLEGAPFDWQPEETPQTFTKDTLYDLMNGQSDAFFVYGFQQAAVQRFKNEQGAPMIVTIYQVDTPDSAYGLFSANRDPQLVTVGSQGSQAPGRRISFWQERYLVQVVALEEVAQAGLLSAAQAISAALPAGGETPALIKRLPGNGLQQDPWPIFFHEELSIQDRVFLGGENLMGLGADTNGVLGQYTLSGQPVWLMLVEYPDAQRAEKGLAALQSAEMRAFSGGMSSASLLAAVFDAPDPMAVETLLLAALMP